MADNFAPSLSEQIKINRQNKIPGRNPLIKPRTIAELKSSKLYNKTPQKINSYHYMGDSKVFKSLYGKGLSLILILSLSFASLFPVLFLLSKPRLAKAASSVNVWWPTDLAQVSGSQPFKAQVSGMDVSAYNMYWQVDGGQLNLMGNSSQDYPHKESLVSLNGWTWKGSGPYTVNFVAKNFSGSVIAQSSVRIYNTASSASAATNPIQPASATTTTSASTPVTTTTVPTQTTTISSTVTIVYKNGYPTVNGNYIDCNGNVDNDPTHHTTNPADTDPAHHIGQNCPAGSFVAKYGGSATATTTAPPTSSTTTASSAPSIQTSSSSGNPLAGITFYRNVNSNAAQWANSHRSSDPANAALMDKVASQPNAIWLGGWNTNVQSDVANTINTAKSQSQMPVFVVYNIPGRDCGGYSAGGAQTDQDYKNWINAVSAGIGANKAVIVLEPDGVSLIDCLSSTQLQSRYSLLQYAVSTLKANGKTLVYIDAGHANWVGVSDMANRLKQAGIGSADGFALNVSNFTTTSDNTSFGQSVSALTGGKHFIVDTSRNGLGSTPDNQWCNPAGRALGAKPTTNTGNPLVDALFWGKTPGESDGTCNGGPSAGTFWPDYALGLASRASW